MPCGCLDAHCPKAMIHGMVVCCVVISKLFMMCLFVGLATIGVLCRYYRYSGLLGLDRVAARHGRFMEAYLVESLGSSMEMER